MPRALSRDPLKSLKLTGGWGAGQCRINQCVGNHPPGSRPGHAPGLSQPRSERSNLPCGVLDY